MQREAFIRKSGSELVFIDMSPKWCEYVNHTTKPTKRNPKYCSRLAVIEVDGKRYCEYHNPKYVKYFESITPQHRKNIENQHREKKVMKMLTEFAKSRHRPCIPLPVEYE